MNSLGFRGGAARRRWSNSRRVFTWVSGVCNFGAPVVTPMAAQAALVDNNWGVWLRFAIAGSDNSWLLRFFQNAFLPPIGPPLAGFGRYFGVRKLAPGATFWAHPRPLGGPQKVPKRPKQFFKQSEVFKILEPTIQSGRYRFAERLGALLVLQKASQGASSGPKRSQKTELEPQQDLLGTAVCC